MKFGILTFHRAHNYGAVLQAYAMKYNYAKHGEVELIDYWPEYHGADYDLLDMRFIKSGIPLNKRLKLIRSAIKRLLLVPFRIKRHEKFKCFINEHFIKNSDSVITNPENIPKHYDAYIYGSDQIWRVYDMSNYPRPDLTYLGGNLPEGAKKIAYAASMGQVNTDTLADSEVIKLLNDFDCLGIREKDLKEKIESTLSLNAVQVLDPTFLVPKSHWENLIKDTPRAIEEPYLLFYSLINSDESRKLAEKICIEKNLRLIEINGFETFSGHFDECIMQSAGPLDFLKLINDAEFVVSTSFHGVVFSILFETNFYACGMGNHVARVASLLDILNLNTRLVETSDVFVKPIEFSSITKDLERLIKQSNAFIKHSIAE